MDRIWSSAEQPPPQAGEWRSPSAFQLAQVSDSGHPVLPGFPEHRETAHSHVWKLRRSLSELG